jgi:hypothetical protein
MHDIRQTKTSSICAEHGRPLILLKSAPSTWPPLSKNKIISSCHSVTLYNCDRKMHQYTSINTKWKGMGWGGGRAIVRLQLLQNPKHWLRSHVHVSISISMYRYHHRGMQGLKCAVYSLPNLTLHVHGGDVALTTLWWTRRVYSPYIHSAGNDNG